MTRKELNLAIFEGKADAVLWQPRLETWIHHHQKFGTMPEKYAGLQYLEIYDSLKCSVRYAASAGIEYFNKPDDIKRTEKQEGNYYITTLTTPKGELRTVNQDVREGETLYNRRIVEFPVKTAKDLIVLADIIDRQHFKVNFASYKEAADRVGHRGEPTGWLNSSGFTELIKNHSGLLDTFYLLHDSPGELEEYLRACDRRDDRLIEEAIKLPFKIFNFGDHATNEFSPPPILKKYLLPRWQRLSDKLHSAGRYCHSHWDGNSKTILPYLLDTGLDGVEALTPEPMADMTLEDIKSAVKNKMVVLDLIPAIFCLPNYTVEETVEFTKRAIDMFAPKLILGISDEISQAGEIEKIEAVTELVDKTCGLAN